MLRKFFYAWLSGNNPNKLLILTSHRTALNNILGSLGLGIGLPPLVEAPRVVGSKSTTQYRLQSFQFGECPRNVSHMFTITSETSRVALSDDFITPSKAIC